MKTTLRRQCDNPAMNIAKPCVVALSWTLRDSQNEVLDELAEPVEFMVGGEDLLPAMEDALQGHAAGAVLNLQLEPEKAFGQYDEQLIFLLPRSALPEGVEPGLLVEASTLPAGSVQGVPDDHLFTISDVYPEHIVLDGNHPLSGILLHLQLKVRRVRKPTEEEIQRRSAGTGFFRLQASAPGDAPDS